MAMERNYSIDFIKFFAIFAVVAIHSGTLSGIQLGTINGDDVDFVIDAFARFAVPFFFVASGYLFVQKMKNIEEKNNIQGQTKSQATKQQLSYFKRYTIKLTKLYFAWFIFYFLFELGIKFIETEKTTEALKPMFTDFVASFHLWDIFYYGADSPQHHLWFLLALIWSVFILFIFVKIKLLPLLLVLSLGLNIYGLFGQSYSAFYEVTVNTRDALFFGLFYITLGGMIGAHAQQVKAVARKIPEFAYIGLLIILSLAQVFEGFVTLKIFDGGAENYYVATIPLIIVLFMMIMKHSQIGKNTLVSKIGSNSVGIYVAHVFIMKLIPILLQRFDLAYIQETLTWKLAFTPMVFILAYIMYTAIQMIKNRTAAGIARNMSSRKRKQNEVRVRHVHS